MNDCYRFIALKSPLEIAFRPVPKIIKEGPPYVNIWRIEDFNLVTWPKKGKFYKGDSYLVVWIKAEGRHMHRHIHFWIGSETTQDEAGMAAMKAVELDDYFDGQSVQFREIEGYESKVFLSYFPRIMYESGGYYSTFATIKQNYDDKLWYVKGKRNITLNQKAMSWSNMNCKDVFILDISQCMFLWIGKKANYFEKIKAARVTQELNTERVGKVQIIVVNDGDEKNLPKEELQLFNKHLPIAMKNLNKSDLSPDDSLNQHSEKNLKLYICSDDEGTLKVLEVKCGPLVYSDLTSKDVYIILTQSHIWIWIGRLALNQERREAMNNAMGFAKKKDADLSKIIRVVEGAELEEFKYLFHNWPEPNPSGVSSKSRIATVQTNFDVKSLHQNRQLAAEMRMVDDGDGEVEIYRMQNFNMIPVEKAQYGQFFNGDCYVIIYKYNFKNTEYHLIYYWLGIESSPEEQGAASLKTLELDDGLEGTTTQIRVIQGKEPPHLMTIFKGKMIILMGSHDIWGKKNDILAACPGRNFMLQVCGTTSFNTKALQVPMRAASLNSSNVFVIFDGHRSYIWAGKGSTGDEREMAKNISNGATFIPEGQEKPDFWNCLGGIETYTSDKPIQNRQWEHIPRLFCMSNMSSINYQMEEICNFEQQDLIPDDIMLLDTWDSLFLWIGKEAQHDEKKYAVKSACEYLETDPSCRPTDIPIYRVNQGHEPPIFTGFFNVWNENTWRDAIKFEQIQKELKLNNMNIPLNEVPSAKYSGQTFREVPKFAYVLLAGKAPDMLPREVDPANKELHLTDMEFMRVFQMTYMEYFQLPLWRKQALKKSLGLF